MKYAESVLKEIERRVEIGTFDFKEFFPDSKNVKKEEEKKFTPPLFKEVVEDYLEFKKMDAIGLSDRITTRGIAGTSLIQYASTIKTHFSKPFDEKIMAKITLDEIVSVMSRLTCRNKTFNNILSNLNCIYEYAVMNKAKTGVTENHCKQISRVENEETAPDPLMPDEVEMVLDDMRQFYHPHIADYFELAFRIGFRPSEGIDLRWKNVDWNRKEILINSAMVLGIKKVTKTKKSRLVELDDECMAILERQKQYTFMRFDEIFFWPVTDKPFRTTTRLIKHYWRPSLKRCGIRDRDARQTRHTCATLMLMGGADVEWAARQLGHSVEVFRKTYALWVPKLNKRNDRDKVSAMFKTGLRLITKTNEIAPNA